MINVRFINNDGSGFLQTRQVEEGTTISQFLADSSTSTDNRTVTVNRETVAEDYILRDNDRITVAPTKYDAA